MSTPTEYESKAQQDYGPTASTNVIQPLLESKLAKRRSLNSPDAAVMCSISSLTSENNPEPDSTQTIDRTMIQTFQTKFDKAHDAISRTDSEYQISNIDEGECDADVAVGTISSIVKIEEAGLENVTRLSYPVVHERHETNDEFITNQSTATLMSSSMDSAIVQNITKLPQNFTLNVETGLANIATIQNVSQDVSTNQTLWLPTILATSSTSALDGKTMSGDRSQTGVSQIIITSATENYIPHSINNQNVSVKRSNIVTDANANRTKTSKVQILSNITIPKPSNIASIAQYDTSNVKDTVEPTIYGTQSHLYKLSASVTSIPHKHGASNSILNNKVGKTQSLISNSSALPIVNQVQGKASVAYTSNFQKASHLNRSMNKVNNGANNTSNSLSNVAGQCHIFSRMVPGPKLSVHSGRKNVNSFSSGKNVVKSAVTQSPTTVSSQKSQQQNSKPIKIIQQTTNLQSPNKNEMKSWAITHTNTNVTKTFTPVDSTGGKTIASQKLSPMQHKGLHGVVSLQKLASTKNEQQRLVLHSSQVIIPNATPQTTTHLKSQPNQQVQRYVQNYITTNNNQLGSVTQISANQHLTAQILQSLSQPKLVLQAGPVITHQDTSPKCSTVNEAESSPLEIRHDQKRQIHGDPSTLLTADDIIGMEERPNINDELLRYPYHDLALVMLDHTYAVCAQSMPSISTGSTVTGSTTLTSSPISTVASLASGMVLSSPTLTSGQVLDNSTRSPPTSVPPIPTNTSNQNTMIYKPQPVQRPDDDDAGSVISSVEDQDAPRDGSDTETAPEGEEEGKTRCVCEFTHDDGYMICCDRCSEWQHVDCMGIDRQNIPDTYMCDRCQPRPIDRRRARMIQLRKREELSALVPSDSDSSDGVPHTLGPRRRRLLTVTTYSNTSGPKLPQFNQAPCVPVQPTPPIVSKRGPKRPRRTDIARKGTKRKIPEKRVKRKKDFILNRTSKYNQVANVNQNHCLNDSYESAMTNHYSPELRAKVVRYSSKLGSMPNIASAINAHYCTTVPHAGGKILIATKDLKESMPVIELRGKYMLANQHRPQPQLSSRSGGQKPGPFLFFYRLPKDNTQICIDTRTYGNEARFVRRSCKPNAELQHSIVKGVLHVYIITISAIQSNTEITIGHDTTTSKQPCACGNPKYCNMNGMSNLALRKMQHAEFVREKRTRNRRSSSSSPASPTGQVVAPLTPKEQNTRLPFVKHEKKSPVKLENNVTSPIKYTEYLSYIPVPEEKNEGIVPKEETSDTVDGDDNTASYDETKMKMEPIEEEESSTPKIIENYSIVKEEEKTILEEVKPPSLFATDKKVLEEDVPKEEYEVKPILPTEHIKSEFIKVKEEEKNCQMAVSQALPVKAASIVSTRTSRTSIVSNSFIHDSLDDKTDDSQDKQINSAMSAKDKKKMTREERKMEAIMKAFERMEKAEQRKQEVRERQSKRRESDPIQPTAGGCEKEIDIDEENALQSSAKKRRKRKGRARTTSQNAQSNRRRLNSADSDMMTSGDEAVSQTSPHPPAHFSEPEPMDTPSVPQTLTPEMPVRVTDDITEDVGLSSACLLVEAAVGPLENAFKLPKTKKSIVSEWLGKSPERTSSTEYSQPLSFSIDSGLPYSAPKPTLLTPRSLESLVQVASTIIGDLSGGTICADSSPEKSYYGSNSEDRFTALTPTDSPQKLTAEEIFQSPEAQSPVRPSLLTPIKRSPRNLQKELAQPPLDKIKTPKKYKRGLRAVIEDRITATRRTLRSTPQLEAEKPLEEIPEAAPQVEMSTANSSVTPISVQTPFQLPQHSAKKRWLRQAISEESDSPTAESPPNEMVTPLKKRRLARESLSCEPSNLNMHFEDVSSIALPPDAPPPVKAIHVESTESTSQTYKLKPVVSPHKYDHDDYHADNVEGTGSNEHSMDCKFDSGGDYLDINLRNRHDAKKFKMDIRRIIGVPGTEENVDVVEDIKDLPCSMSEKRLSRDNSIGDDANKSDNTLADEKVEENNLDTSIELDSTDNKSELVESQEDTIGENPLNSKPMIDNIADSKSETHSNANSTETSGNSSPQVDEMDDIQKKIHSFHTENIQILKIRNKKLPKEKRKKVNLNFDLCMLDDQTVGVKLRTDSGQNTPKSPEVNGEVTQEEHDASPLNVLPINVEDIPVPDYRPDSPPVREKNEAQCVIVMEAPSSVPTVVDDKPRILQSVEAAIPSDGGLTFSSHFSSGGLFSGLFGSTCHAVPIDSSLTLNDNVPNMNIIKSAIDRTTNMENSAFMDRTTLTPVDELRNVQEILSRVNKMDSNNSVLLSGVLKDTEISSKIEVTQPSPVKTFSPKSNDPRLNPPPVEKPKPMRRKLSITEYRKRHNMQSSADSSSAESKAKDSTDQSPRLGTDSNSNSSGSTFRGGGSVSPLRISDDAIADDIDSRLERQLEESLHEHSSTIPPDLCSDKKGLFDAQPTQVERQRENLSERLRREFGLSLPEDEEARSATALQDPIQSLDIPLPSEQSSYEQAQAFLRPALPHKLQRFDR